MNNIKTFESFFNEEEFINEGLMSFIKKLPFYDEAKKVYLKLKEKIEEVLKDLPKEDLNKIKSFSPSKNENFKLTLEGKGDMVNKVLGIFGISSASIGLLSGLIAMITAEMNNNATEATPWFIACVILLAVGGITHFMSNDFEDDKKSSSKKVSKSSRNKDPYLRRK